MSDGRWAEVERRAEEARRRNAELKQEVDEALADMDGALIDGGLVELALAAGGWPRSEWGREKMARSLAAVLPYISPASEQNADGG